jgi:hypothetical protein
LVKRTKTWKNIPNDHKTCVQNGHTISPVAVK